MSSYSMEDLYNLVETDQDRTVGLIKDLLEEKEYYREKIEQCLEEYYYFLGTVHMCDGERYELLRKFKHMFGMFYPPEHKVNQIK
jgi:hypothetical protein